MGDPERVSRALAMEICFRSAGGSATHANAKALLVREWEIAQEVNTPESLAMAHTATGYVQYFVGEWSGAQRSLATAEELFRDRCVGATFQLNSARIMLYRVLAFRGDLKELAGRVPAALREVEQRSDHYSIVNMEAGPMTLLALADDAPDRVRDALGAVGERLPKGAFLVQHYFAVVAQCQLDLYGGNSAAALERLEATWPALRRSLLLRVQAILIATLEQRARVAITAFVSGASRRPDLLAIAEADARKLGRLKLEWATASSTMLRGAIAAAKGEREPALALLDEAARRFDALGMTFYAAACQRRAGELRGGEAGDAVRSADERMSERGVKRPDRMAAIFVPPVRRT
jgi:hypothetical protein